MRKSRERKVEWMERRKRMKEKEKVKENGG